MFVFLEISLINILDICWVLANNNQLHSLESLDYLPAMLGTRTVI